MGSGSTPRKGAGSIATDTAARPRPARIWVSSPPVEWPMIAGLRSSPPMMVSKWSATWPIDLPVNTSGCSAASSTVSGRPATRGQRHIAVVLEQLGPAIPAVGQQPQAVHEHHRRAPGLVGALALLQLVLGDRHVARRGARPGIGHGGPPVVVVQQPMPNIRATFRQADAYL